MSARAAVKESSRPAAATVNEWACRLLRVKREPVLLPITVGVMCFSMTMDISKARSRLGYRPRFTTEDGIREFLAGWH